MPHSHVWLVAMGDNTPLTREEAVALPAAVIASFDESRDHLLRLMDCADATSLSLRDPAQWRLLRVGLSAMADVRWRLIRATNLSERDLWRPQPESTEHVDIGS